MERDRVYLPKNPSLPTVPSQLATLPCFFAILESSFDGIFITNGQAVPIWVNHSYEVISGLSARDVLGIPMDELVRRGLISNSATLQALEIGHSYTANQSFVTGKQALVTSTPIYDENDQVCLVVTNVRDISELVSLQETLDQQRRLSSRYQQEIEVIRNQLLGSSQMVAEDPATLDTAAPAPAPTLTGEPLQTQVDRFEAALIAQALAQAPSLRAAARLAQMDPATFLRRKKKYQALGLLSPEE